VAHQVLALSVTRFDSSHSRVTPSSVTLPVLKTEEDEPEVYPEDLIRGRQKLLSTERLLKEAVFISAFHQGLCSTDCSGRRIPEARGMQQRPQPRSHRRPRTDAEPTPRP